MSRREEINTADEFIREHNDWLMSLVESRMRAWPDHLKAERREDAEQAAYLGVIEAFASKDYDPELGHPITFVFRYVERELQRLDKERWPAVSVPWSVVDGRTPAPEIETVDAEEVELPHDGGITAAIETTSAEVEVEALLPTLPAHLRRTMQIILDHDGDPERAARDVDSGISRATIYRHLKEVRQIRQ